MIIIDTEKTPVVWPLRADVGRQGTNEVVLTEVDLFRQMEVIDCRWNGTLKLVVVQEEVPDNVIQK